MPIKPVQTITEWASDDLWSIGPKVGELTKADYSGIAPQGHVPGTDNPSTGNEQNDYQNKMSKVGIWTQGGTALKILEAHIVEANATGLAEIACLDVGGTSSNQPPFVAGENTGTNAASVFVTSRANDGIRSETTEKFGLVVRSRAQLGTSSFWTAEIDGTYDNGPDPAGKSGGLRILADNDELIAPVPPAQHPLNGRGLFVRNANGVAAEFVSNAGFGLHSSNFAVIIGNSAVKGNGLRVNTAAGPEPIGGNGIETYGGQAFFDTVISANSFHGGAGVIGRGGAADPGGDGQVDSDKSRSGAGVMGFAGVPRLGILGSTNAAGAGIHGVSENIGPGVAYAGLFERIASGIGTPGNTGAVVRVEAGKESTGIFGLEVLTGHANAIKATSFGGTALFLSHDESDNVPGLYGAHLNFGSPRGNNPSNPIDGDMWWKFTNHTTGDGGDSSYIKIKKRTPRFLSDFENPQFKQQKLDGDTMTSADENDEQNVFGNFFEFPIDNVPENAPSGSNTTVALRVTYRVRLSVGSPALNPPWFDLISWRLYDNTANGFGGPVVKEVLQNYGSWDLLDNTFGPYEDKSFTMLYILPTAGQRQLRLAFAYNAIVGGNETIQCKDFQLEMFAWNA